jgi:hypothetical protein
LKTAKYAVSSETDYICNAYTGNVTTIYFNPENTDQQLLDPVVICTPDNYNNVENIVNPANYNNIENITEIRDNENAVKISEFKYNTSSSGVTYENTVVTYATFDPNQNISTSIPTSKGSTYLFPVIKTH